MEQSTFADRFWWARHRVGLGSTRLARLAGCSSGLISAIERRNAEGSRLVKTFADVLQVDPTWLAYGVESKAPQGFDATAAREGREAMLRGDDKSTSLKVVRLPRVLAPPPAEPALPRWVGEPAGQEGAQTLKGADARMKTIVMEFMEFARGAGPERALRLLETLKHIASLVSFEEADRQDKVGSANEGNHGSDN